jgi:TetR/AcrR family transcriptional regulator
MVYKEFIEIGGLSKSSIVNRGIKILIGMIEEETQRQQAPGINALVIKTAVIQFLIEYPSYAQAYLYFRSGKFNIWNCNCMNPDAKEVLEITKELLDQIISEYGIGNDNSKPDMNHVVTTVFYVLIFEGILNGVLNVDPIIKDILAVYGISTQLFQTEALNLVQRLVINHEGGTGI